MNERGKWFLVYRDINYDASLLRGEAFVETKDELNAEDREAALVKAESRWNEVLARGVDNAPDYEVRGADRKNFPREPRIRYEEDLSTQFQNPDNLRPRSR